MLNTWRGLMLAAGVAAIPAFAQAECPPQESIDRYAQTARDALVALDGLVPEEQQRALENRYIAMSVLRWSWQGRDAILNEPSALDGITQCIDSGLCDALASERSGAGPRTIAPFPSDRLVKWANRQLECGVTAPAEPVDEIEVATEETSVEPDLAADSDLAADPETTDTPAEQAADAAPEPDLVTDTGVETNDLTTPEIEDVIASEEAIPEDELNLDLPLSDVIIDSTETAIGTPPAQAPIDALSMSSGSQQHLARAAVLLMMKGNLPGSIETFSQACYQAAEQSDPVQSCELIFDHYDRLAVRADPIAFLAFTDQLCRVNYTRGCARLATYFGVETTTEAHLAALKFYDRACNSGDAEACAAASDYFLTGRAELPDPTRARDTLFRSCDLGRLASCQPLAEFYARGVGGDVDLDRAFELNEISCSTAQIRSAETCVAAADFVLLNMEEGVDRDQQVRTFVERACRIGHDVGCALHADNLEYGIGGAVDLAGAEQARDRACRLGHEASCEPNS